MFSAALALPSETQIYYFNLFFSPMLKFCACYVSCDCFLQVEKCLYFFHIRVYYLSQSLSKRSLVLKLAGVTLIFKSEWKAMQRFLLEFVQEFETEVWEVQSVLVSSTIDSKTWRGHHGWWVSFLSLLVIWKEASGFSLDGFKWSSVLCYVWPA